MKIETVKAIITVPDEKEYIRLVDLHDMLGVHEVDPNSISQCLQCGCQVTIHSGAFQSALSYPQRPINYTWLKPSHDALKHEAIERHAINAYYYVEVYGVSDDTHKKILSECNDNIKLLYARDHMPIGEACEPLLKGSRAAQDSYARRARRTIADRIKKIKELRNNYLARNKEIWQTLTGRYGEERQQMLDELEEGIALRKQLKAEEKNLIAYKHRIQGWIR